MSIIQFVNGLGETLEQGDIVVIGDKQPRLGRNQDIIPEVDLTDRVYDTRVCGIVTAVRVDLRIESPEEEKQRLNAKKKLKAESAQPDKPPQPEARSIEELDEIDQSKVEPGTIGLMIAFGMFPYCKVDADIAPIKAGDLLTTSPTKGHAQKVLDLSQATGSILGKALAPLKKGKGKIPVIVSLQ